MRWIYRYGVLFVFLISCSIWLKIYILNEQQQQSEWRQFEHIYLPIMSNTMEAVIQRYNPIFVFHEEERDFPISVEQYLAVAGIGEFDVKDRLISVLHAGPLTQKSLSEFSAGVSNWTGLSLFLREDAPEQRTKVDPRAPVYVNYYTQNGMLYINYILFYILNMGKVGPLRIGNHAADVEHSVVELNPSDFAPQRLYNSAHGTEEGKWIAWNDVPKSTPSPGDLFIRPIVYVAKGGHGHYNKPGHVVRFFGFGNDITSDKGPRLLGLPALIDGYDITITVPDPNFNALISGLYLQPGVSLKVDNRFKTWQGSLGGGSVHFPQYQGWWNNVAGNGESAAPPIMTNTTYEILFWTFVALLILIVLLFAYSRYKRRELQHQQQKTILALKTGDKQLISAAMNSMAAQQI